MNETEAHIVWRRCAKQETKGEKAMRLYVIGPVSGFDDLNKQAFIDAYNRLTHNGYAVLIPHDFVSESADWSTAMKRSLETMFKCDGIAMLEGCDRSHGALLEKYVAEQLGVPCHTVDEWSCGIFRVPSKEDLKQCPNCKRVLPLTLFGKSASSNDGRQTYCRACMNGYKRKQKAR